jgi:hypothetical protein
MLQFRVRAREVTHFNAGVLEANSPHFRLGVELTAAIARRLEDDIAALDRALAQIVDPGLRTLPWGELVREFGFPDGDYEALRSEEW